MELWERERLAVWCLDALENNGLSLKIVRDPKVAAGMLDSSGRSFSTFPLDYRRVAFTRTNAFWIFLVQNDELYMGCGVRIDDLGDESFDAYFRRTSLATYGAETVAAVDVFPSNVLRGKVAYWGDLVSPPRSSKSLAANGILRMFCFYALHRCFADHRVDWSYCFMLDKMFQRGAPQAYNFLNSLPFVWDWGDRCPFPGGKPDWVAYIGREHLPFLSRKIEDLLFDQFAIN